MKDDKRACCISHIQSKHVVHLVKMINSTGRVLRWGIVGCGKISGDMCQSLALLPKSDHQVYNASYSIRFCLCRLSQLHRVISNVQTSSHIDIRYRQTFVVMTTIVNCMLIRMSISSMLVYLIMIIWVRWWVQSMLTSMYYARNQSALMRNKFDKWYNMRNRNIVFSWR